jgi:hypothetical protein
MTLFHKWLIAFLVLILPMAGRGATMKVGDFIAITSLQMSNVSTNRFIVSDGFQFLTNATFGPSDIVSVSSLVWTNDNGTLKPVAFPTNILLRVNVPDDGVGTNFYFDSRVFRTNGQSKLFQIYNGGSNALTIGQNGQLMIGRGNSTPLPGVVLYGIFDTALGETNQQEIFTLSGNSAVGYSGASDLIIDTNYGALILFANKEGGVKFTRFSIQAGGGINPENFNNFTMQGLVDGATYFQVDPSFTLLTPSNYIFSSSVRITNIHTLLSLQNSNFPVLEVDGVGDLRLIKKVPYTWPSAQGGAGTILTNDGAGNLGWGTDQTSGGGVAFSDLVWTNDPSIPAITLIPSVNTNVIRVVGSIVASNLIDHFNVLWWGADPTGVSDSTAAIQNAIDWAANGAVYIPRGSYLISELRITNQFTTIYGDGPGISALISVSTVPMITLSGSGADTVIKDINLQGNNKATYGIFITNNCEQSIFENIVIDQINGVGIYARTNSFGLLFDRCRILRCSTGVKLDYGFENSGFDHCLFYNNTNYQIVLGVIGRNNWGVAIHQTQIASDFNAPTNLLINDVSTVTLDGVYFESVQANGKDIVIDGTTSSVDINGMYSNGNNASTNSILVIGTTNTVSINNSFLWQFTAFPFVTPGKFSIGDSSLNGAWIESAVGSSPFVVLGDTQTAGVAGFAIMTSLTAPPSIFSHPGLFSDTANVYFNYPAGSGDFFFTASGNPKVSIGRNGTDGFVGIGNGVETSLALLSVGSGSKFQVDAAGTVRSGSVAITNVPGLADPFLRITQTNGLGYSEFTTTNSVIATNCFVWSFGSNTVSAGQVAKVHSTVISAGINNIVLTNDTDNSVAGGAQVWTNEDFYARLAGGSTNSLKVLTNGLQGIAIGDTNAMNAWGWPYNTLTFINLLDGSSGHDFNEMVFGIYSNASGNAWSDIVSSSGSDPYFQNITRVNTNSVLAYEVSSSTRKEGSLFSIHDQFYNNQVSLVAGPHPFPSDIGVSNMVRARWNGLDRFVVQTNGHITMLGVTYVPPTAQGAAGTALTNNGSGALGWWPIQVGGGGISTNANQFGANVTLSIKEGALLTNTLFYPSNLTAPATIQLASVGSMTNLTEWRQTNGAVALAISSNGLYSVAIPELLANAIAFRTNQIDFKLAEWKAFSASLKTNLVLQLTNCNDGVTHTLSAFGAGRLGGGLTNAWQLLCTSPAGCTIYWPPGTTNGNYDVLVNSNQVVTFTFRQVFSTNIFASYLVGEAGGAN